MVLKGAKAKKNKGAATARRGKGSRRNNPKAFLAASGVASQRRNAHRSLEKQERQYHAPLADRSVEAVVAPPFIVAVVGPAGVGKTTIIKSLVKHWTKQNIAEAMGPVGATDSSVPDAPCPHWALARLSPPSKSQA